MARKLLRLRRGSSDTFDYVNLEAVQIFQRGMARVRPGQEERAISLILGAQANYFVGEVTTPEYYIIVEAWLKRNLILPEQPRSASGRFAPRTDS
jgi:hypothetical protein